MKRLSILVCFKSLIKHQLQELLYISHRYTMHIELLLNHHVKESNKIFGVLL